MTCCTGDWTHTHTHTHAVVLLSLTWDMVLLLYPAECNHSTSLRPLPVWMKSESTSWFKGQKTHLIRYQRSRQQKGGCVRPRFLEVELLVSKRQQHTSSEKKKQSWLLISNSIRIIISVYNSLQCQPPSPAHKSAANLILPYISSASLKGTSSVWLIPFLIKAALLCSADAVVESVRFALSTGPEKVVSVPQTCPTVPQMPSQPHVMSSGGRRKEFNIYFWCLETDCSHQEMQSLPARHTSLTS